MNSRNPKKTFGRSSEYSKSRYPEESQKRTLTNASYQKQLQRIQAEKENIIEATQLLKQQYEDSLKLLSSIDKSKRVPLQDITNEPLYKDQASSPIKVIEILEEKSCTVSTQTLQNQELSPESLENTGELFTKSKVEFQNPQKFAKNSVAKLPVKDIKKNLKFDPGSLQFYEKTGFTSRRNPLDTLQESGRFNDIYVEDQYDQSVFDLADEIESLEYSRLSGVDT